MVKCVYLNFVKLCLDVYISECTLCTICVCEREVSYMSVIMTRYLKFIVHSKLCEECAVLILW